MKLSILLGAILMVTTSCRRSSSRAFIQVDTKLDASTISHDDDTGNGPCGKNDDRVSMLYEFLSNGSADKAAGLFAPDGVYAHTGEETVKATSIDAMQLFLEAMISKGVFNGSNSFKIESEVSSSEAVAYVVTRPGKRDSIVISEAGIVAMFTTNASPKDDFPSAEKIRLRSTRRRLWGKASALKKVQRSVDVYFNGFEGEKPREMQSAYVEDQLYYMFDFNSERQVPFGCMMDPPACATAPAMFSKDQLLPAFQGFAQGYIKLAHKFTRTEVYGRLAYATTVSLGCEGDNVTPKGSPPMPNRELFVLVKQRRTWRIKSYMFTYDPASPLTPPVEKCPPE